jgi:hypothetical protein
MAANNGRQKSWRNQDASFWGRARATLAAPPCRAAGYTVPSTAMPSRRPRRALAAPWAAVPPAASCLWSPRLTLAMPRLGPPRRVAPPLPQPTVPVPPVARVLHATPLVARVQLLWFAWSIEHEACVAWIS